VMIAARPAARAVTIAEPLPASFAAETAVLDAIAPLIRSGTMLQTRGASLEDTAALRDGSGGSHRGGWPYLPISEAWPTCPRCKRQIPCFMQFDMRDVLHDPPPSHALFVIYRCRDCYSPDNVVVRHYPTPSAAERRPIDLTAPIPDDHEIFVMERRAHMLPDYEIVEADHPDVLAKLRWAWARSASPITSAAGRRRSTPRSRPARATRSSTSSRRRNGATTGTASGPARSTPTSPSTRSINSDRSRHRRLGSRLVALKIRRFGRGAVIAAVRPHVRPHRDSDPEFARSCQRARATR